MDLHHRFCLYGQQLVGSTVSIKSMFDVDMTFYITFQVFGLKFILVCVCVEIVQSARNVYRMNKIN